MNPELKFVVFAVLSVVCFGLGYFARIKGLVKEESSRKIHFVTVVIIWSLLSVFGIWKMGVPEASHAWVLLISPMSMVLLMAICLLLAKWIGCTREQQGVMIICAGVCNCGSNLGAFLCFLWLKPADMAFGAGIEYLTVMIFSAVLFIYPMARKFSVTQATDEALPILMVKSLMDVRSLSLYAAVVGIVLAWMAVPVPALVSSEWMTLFLVVCSCVGAYFGIGLRMRFGDGKELIRQHLGLAAMQFVVSPLISAGLVWAVGFGPNPPDRMMVMVYMTLSAMPSGIMSVAISNMFHLDARLAASLWFWNTLIFVVLVLPVLWMVVPG